jgi:hypothetical protein
MAAPSYERRREDLILALRTLNLVQETLQRGDSGGRFEPGPKILQMPAAWHAGDHPALVEALRKLRKHGPHHYWCVDARYISPERTTKTLVYRPSNRVGERYFEAVAKNQDGETAYYAGSRLDLRNAEVIAAKTEPRARVLRGRGEPQAQLVRAIVERWDPAVKRRPLELGIDFLLSQMPLVIRLPREVRDAA